MSHKAIFSIITTAALIAAVVFKTSAQSTSIGARFTYTLLPSALVKNPSPSNIYGSVHTSFDAGIYGLKYFKGDRFGIKLGGDFGLIPWDLGVDAPTNAFGNGTGDNLISVVVSYSDFSYKAATVSAVYKLPLNTKYLELAAGASIRDYAFGQESDGIYYAFNRPVRYDPDDPTHGPPDINAQLQPLDDQFHINFPVSADFVISTSERTRLKLGLMHNITLKPISESQLTVVMYGQTYTGKFSPRTSFWGFNVLFEYGLSKPPNLVVNSKPTTSSTFSRYRKSLFIERRGSGGFISANYDTRLKRGVNDGIGIKAGIGLGNRYYTHVTNNNKSTERRYISIPVGLNYIIGAQRHGIEGGAGFTAQVAHDDVLNGSDFISSFPLNIGYRFQPIREGLLVRASWTPFFNSFGFYSKSAGLSVGYSFN